MGYSHEFSLIRAAEDITFYRDALAADTVLHDSSFSSGGILYSKSFLRWGFRLKRSDWIDINFSVKLA
jgi:hypothetical protein